MIAHLDIVDSHQLVVAERNEGMALRLLENGVLRGCNIHHRGSVFRQQLDLGGLAGLYTAEVGPGFACRFIERFLALEKLTPEGHMTDDFLARLSGGDGVPIEEALFEAILAVELSMAFAMRRLDTLEFARIVRAESGRIVELVWECHLPRLSRGAARVGLAGVTQLLPGRLQACCENSGEDFDTLLRPLRKRALRRQWSSTAAILALAAKKRGLPCESLGDAYLLLGRGVAQHVVYASVAGNSSFVDGRACGDKRAMNVLLRESGIPVPRQLEAGTRPQAAAAASTLGYPLAIKPRKSRQGRGVSVRVGRDRDLVAAFARARKQDADVLIETCVEGQAYSLLVVGGRFVAALHLALPKVTGDGQRSIRQLVDELNSQPLRNGVRLHEIPVDDELEASLGLRGHRLDDVLEEHVQLPLHLVASMELGAVHSDVTDAVNARNRELAVRAATTLGLQVASIDFVTTDITKPHDQTGGCVVDVSAVPDLRAYALPRYGEPRDVGSAVLNLILPPGATTDIPKALIAGKRGTSMIARELDALLRAAGKAVGVATRRFSSVCGEIVDPGSNGRDAARFLLHDPRLQVFVTARSPRRIARRGLQIDGCTVAAIVDSAADREADTFEQGFEVVVKATSGLLALPSEDELVEATLRAVERRRLILLAPRGGDLQVRRHLAAGGLAVLLTSGSGPEHIELRRGDEMLLSVPISSTGAGAKRDERRIRTRMWAVALAFGLGLSAAEIASAARRWAYLRA